MRTIHLPLAIAVLLADFSHGVAQETTGTINGRVVDDQGLAIPGGTITVTGTQGAKVLTTDAEGRFAAASLTPGKYEVRAELQGFRTVQNGNVTVALGQTVELPLKLEIGFTELVEVVGASEIVNTRTLPLGPTSRASFCSRCHSAAMSHLQRIWRPA
jgi:hypothetical protein